MNAARGSNGYVPNAGAIIGVPPKLIIDKNSKKEEKNHIRKLYEEKYFFLHLNLKFLYAFVRGLLLIIKT